MARNTPSGAQVAPREKAGAARSAARTLLSLEVRRSFRAIVETTGAFAVVWSAFRESLGAAPGVERRRRRRIGAGGWVVLVLALAAVVYGAVMVLARGVLALVPEAQAQALGPGMLGASDPKTLELLDFLFGMTRGEGYGIAEMIRFFNMGVLVVVGALTVYHVLFAVVETGRTGEGKLSGWQMMRLVAGLGLVFPLPATGLGPGQHALLELTDMGASLAAGVWSRFAGVIVEGGPGAPVRIPPGYQKMVADVVLLETCMYIHNEVAARAGDTPYITVQRREKPGEVRYLYRDPSPGDRHWPCGFVSLVTAIDVENPGARVMALAHDAALRAPAMVWGLERSARELGRRYLPDTPQSGEALPEVDAWFEGTGLARAYASGLETQVAAASAASRGTLREEVDAAIERQGWLGASSFFLVLSRNHAVFLDAVAAVPKVEVLRGEGEGIQKWVGRLFDRVVEPWDEAGAELSEWLGESTAGESSGRVALTEGGGWWTGLLDWMDVDWFKPESATAFGSGNPLEELVTMGHWMMGAGLAALGYQGVVQAIPIVGQTVKNVTGGGMVSAVAVMVLIGGLLLAFMVPAMPFLRSLFGIVAWVISVVEALIAVPLFLAIQVGGEGHRLVSRASHGGYLLILHAVVRPALMILGLVFGYFVFLASMDLFNWLYVEHLYGLTGASRMNVLTSLVALGMYVVVAFAVANATFKCIDLVPQEVLHWLGSRVRGAGDEAGGASRLMEGMTSKLNVFRGFGR